MKWLFSTGDELRSIGEVLGEGEIYDSNRYTLWGLLSRSHVDVLDMGVVEDGQEALMSKANCFIVLTESESNPSPGDQVRVEFFDHYF